MGTDRRTVLGYALAGLGALACPSQAQAGAPSILSAYRRGRGDHGVALLDGAGTVRHDWPMPVRGHGFVRRPGHRQCVAVARRPGAFAVVLDTRTGAVEARIEAPRHTVLAGHAAYSQDGSMLYLTENAFDAGKGVLGAYDPRRGHRRVGELPSHGIGPHELIAAEDPDLLTVANGGILTHPDTGRAKLNIPTMSPNLAHVHRLTGALVAWTETPPDARRLSIRHVARLGDRTFIATQNEGPSTDIRPLVGVHRPGEPLRWLDAPDPVWRACDNYCGSVAVEPAAGLVAITSPRGGTLVVWDAETEQLRATARLPDVCGIAAAGRGRFLVTNGLGLVARLEGQTGALTTVARHAEIAWDNHIG